MQIKRIELIEKSIFENDFISILDDREDYFCKNSLIISNLTNVLWDILKSLKFKRIIFFGINEKIFFLDKESKELCFSGQGEKLVSGPLGEIDLINFNNNYSENKKFLSDKIQYNMMIKSIEKLVFENIPTCFVFIEFENISSENSNYIIKSINRCLNLRNNNNKFILTCNSSSLNTLINNLKLKSYFKNIELNRPCKIEIMNLINNFRIINKVKIDWNNIDSFIENIYQENFFLKDIYNDLKKINDLSEFKLKDKIDKNKDNNTIEWIEL